MTERAVVYVVAEGEYSSRHIVGIYTTRELAEARARDMGDVLEYLLDPRADELRNGLTLYQVLMDRDGNTEHAYSMITEYEYDGAPPIAICTKWAFVDGKATERKPFLRSHQWARDEAHAIKIANERRASIIADGWWPNDLPSEVHREARLEWREDWTPWTEDDREGFYKG